jgi:hypothetical protein
MSYYNHQYASNSDLKKLISRYVEGREEPDLEEIFDLGTLIHQAILEPHKANKQHKDYELASKMAKTVLKDRLCRDLIFMPDFKREHEFYRVNVHGIRARAKMDGSSNRIRTILEYKGLKIANEKAFDESIYKFDYDQGAAWYLDTSGYDRLLIVAVSKTDPNKIFKRIIDRNHNIYKSGLVKVERAVMYWKQYFEEVNSTNYENMV